MASGALRFCPQGCSARSRAGSALSAGVRSGSLPAFPTPRVFARERSSGGSSPAAAAELQESAESSKRRLQEGKWEWPGAAEVPSVSDVTRWESARCHQTLGTIEGCCWFCCLLIKWD